MKLSKQLFLNGTKVPKDINQIQTKDLFSSDFGIVHFQNPGVPTYLPIGFRIKKKLEGLFGEALEERDFVQIGLPRIHGLDLIEKSGKFEGKYEDEFLVSNGMVLRATSEELILELASKGLVSYRQLPIAYFANSTANRNVLRAKGIERLREFSGAVGSILAESRADLETYLQLFDESVRETLELLNVPYEVREKNYGFEFFYIDKNDNDISIAMAYSSSFSDDFRVRFQDVDNQMKVPFMGTFGIGLERTLYSVFDSSRTQNSLNLPQLIKPFKCAVVPVDPKNLRHVQACQYLSRTIKDSYVDDRPSLSMGDRLTFAEFLGVEEKKIIGNREIENYF